MIEQPAQCPYCRYTVMINLKWAQKNGRVFCSTCCKSFEVHVGEEENEPEKETIPSKVETALEELEKEIDKAIDEYEIPDTDDYSWF